MPLFKVGDRVRFPAPLGAIKGPGGTPITQGRIQAVDDRPPGYPDLYDVVVNGADGASVLSGVPEASLTLIGPEEA